MSFWGLCQDGGIGPAQHHGKKTLKILNNNEALKLTLTREIYDQVYILAFTKIAALVLYWDGIDF